MHAAKLFGILAFVASCGSTKNPSTRAPGDETSDEISDETSDETGDETSDETSDETGDNTGDDTGDHSPTSPGDLGILSEVDPHVQALSDAILTEGDLTDVLSWPGEMLIPQDYLGSMKAPGGVLAGHMGNDLDRCRLVRELLSAVEVPSRYVFAADHPTDERCWIEAEVDDAVVWVPTSRLDDTSPLDRSDLLRLDAPHSDTQHWLEILEVTSGSAEGSETSLLHGPLTELSRGPLTASYIDDGDEIRLELKLGVADEARVETGRDISGEDRHDLIFRHTRPDGEITEYRRTLFNAASSVGNQSPDANMDVYGIWMGAHVVGEPYLSIEHSRFDDGTPVLGDALYLRAAELAHQTDHSGYLLFTEGELEGAFIYEDLRIMITGSEVRTDGEDTQTPSFDILANPRAIIGTDDPMPARAALGWSDALTEAALLRQLTGIEALTAPAVFYGLLREEPSGIVSRVEALDAALDRLQDEGVTGEGLRISESTSGATAAVFKYGADIILELDEFAFDLIEPAVTAELGVVAFTTEGLVLDSERERSWPIELLMLEQGAPMDYALRIEHIDSAEDALQTPSGTRVNGTGSYMGDTIEFTALARTYEAPPDGEVDAHDVVDWNTSLESGDLHSSGETAVETPSLTDDGRHSRLLVLGASPSVTGSYQSILWLHPEVASSIRSGLPTDLRIAYPRGASTFFPVTLESFETGAMAVEIDGSSVDIPTIIASNSDGSHQVTIARSGESRLVLGLETPESSSTVTRLNTPRAIRLQGRVVTEMLAPEDPDLTYQMGLGQAEIYQTGRIGRAWQDGTVDVQVPETEQPTLEGSVAILVDSSYSMEAAADPDCATDCASRLDVVRDSLLSIADTAPPGVEIGVWSFDDDYALECPIAATELSDWSLSREATGDAGDRLYPTSGTPLTGAVSAAISRLDDSTWGAAQRLIVLADGDNDCEESLATLSLPEGLEIHTIGVGIADGSTAEAELLSIAERSGGSYTATTTGDDLSEALTALAAAPFEAEPASFIEVEVRAEGYVSKSLSFPSGETHTVVLEPEPDRVAPELVLVAPGDPLPELEDPATRALIEERRARLPEHFFIMPNREVEAGGWPTAFAWLEVNPHTGELSALTHDGLHGAAVVYFGATVTGLWTGTFGVMDNFNDCIFTPEGCGDEIETITETLCDTSGPHAAVVATIVSALATIFTSVDGFLLDTSFNTGMATVRSMCMGRADVGGWAYDEAGAAASAGVGAAYGGAAGLAFSALWNLLHA